MCVCLLAFYSIFHTCSPREAVIRERACVVYTIDLCVWLAFVHSSYVSERVLARADVCMFAESMLFPVPMTGFVFFQLHAFVHPSYVRKRVLARADVCMFTGMLFVVPSGPDWICMQIFHTCTPSCTRHT